MENLMRLAASLQQMQNDNPGTVIASEIDLAFRRANGILSDAHAAALRQIEAQAQAEAARQQAAAESVALLAIPGMVTFGGPVVLDEGAALGEIPAVTYVDLTVPAAPADEDAEDDDEYDDDEYDEYVPEPVALLMTVVGENVTADVVREAYEQVAPSFAEFLNLNVIDGSQTATTLGLTALTAGAVPGTQLFRGELPDLGVTVTLTVDGELGEGQVAPAAPEAIIAARLAVSEAVGEPIPDVERLSLVARREDGDEFTIEQAQPIFEQGITLLSQMCGQHTLVEIRDGDTPAEKVAVLEPAGNGELDRRALKMGAQFRGTRPFPVVGRVTLFARVD